MPKSGENSKPDYKPFHARHWLLFFVFLAGAIFMVHLNSSEFQASVIPTNVAKPYDGTTNPVAMVPKWTSLTSEEWDLPYSQIPTDKKIPFPTYDPNVLKYPVEDLGWSDEDDLSIRNAKITFSVPYMGNYKLDGHEHAGSHLAVDIKVPEGTPVYAIGNGVVVKVSEQTTGFGHHVVIKHEGFPSPDNPSAKETYYSSYSHMGDLHVSEGAVLNKGDLIGMSSDTGTATTPHIHFQIDNDDAPWHPYWPFTFQEASEAGLSFYEAVNSGLGRDKALLTTINPVLYVQKYMEGGPVVNVDPDDIPVVSDEDDNDNDDNTPSELPPPTDIDDDSTDIPDPVDEPEVVEEPEDPAVEFLVELDGSVSRGVDKIVTVKAVNAEGGIVKSYQPEDAVYIQVLLGAADVPDRIRPNEFVDGVAQFEITPTAEAGLQIKVTDNEISGESEAIINRVFSDITADVSSYRAVSFLKEHSVIGGYPDGSFQPDRVVSRVEALKFILNGINADVPTASDLPFSDTFASEWYKDFVATGFSKGIIAGYDDGTFRPANTVNRAEFLKMLLEAMNADLSEVTKDVYNDVPRDAWFAPYVQYAREKNLIIAPGGFFEPEEGMTREEVAEIIYRTIVVKISGERFTNSASISNGEINAYFS